MTSKYLDNSRSIEELDVLFEKDRQSDARLAKITFIQEVAASIRTVADINEVANARIMTETLVASAKISSSAEVHATALLAVAEELRLEIQRRELSSGPGREIDYSIVSELTQSAEERIMTSSRSAIDKISAGAQIAVADIAEVAKTSIADIKKIAGGMSTWTDGNAPIATEQLSKAKQSPRTPESVASAAETASEEIKKHAVLASNSLTSVVTDAIAGMTNSADAVLEHITKMVGDASERIISTRDIALERINELLAVRQR